MEKLSLSQIEQYLSKAAWILKGPVDASDFKVYIFPLLFFISKSKFIFSLLYQIVNCLNDMFKIVVCHLSVQQNFDSFEVSASNQFCLALVKHIETPRYASVLTQNQSLCFANSKMLSRQFWDNVTTCVP